MVYMRYVPMSTVRVGYLFRPQKLKDINADPKSAGELGGLLIKWVRQHVR